MISKENAQTHPTMTHTTCSSAKGWGGGSQYSLDCNPWLLCLSDHPFEYIRKGSGRRMLLLRLHKAELIWLNLSVYFFFIIIFFFSIYMFSLLPPCSTLLCSSFIFVGNWSLLSITGGLYVTFFSSLRQPLSLTQADEEKRKERDEKKTKSWRAK